MPHGNVDSTQATAQNAATEPTEPNDQARDEAVNARPEARSYAAPHLADASLAAPAAGEVGDYAELEAGADEVLAGGQEGRTHNDRERHAHEQGQGPKTLAANRDMARRRSPDQGTQ